MHWFIEPIKNQYADFEGRVGREAFWMFILISFLLQIAVSIVEGIIGTMFFGVLFSLVVLVPSISITARRLHDIGRSGWWQLISFVPLIGIIVLIIWLATKGKSEGNEYGEGISSSDMSPETEIPVAETVVSPEPVSQPENTQQGFEK